VRARLPTLIDALTPRERLVLPTRRVEKLAIPDFTQLRMRRRKTPPDDGILKATEIRFWQ